MKPNDLVLHECCRLFSSITQVSESKRFCLEQSVEYYSWIIFCLDYSYFNCEKDSKSNLFLPVWISKRNPLLWLQRSISPFSCQQWGQKILIDYRTSCWTFSSCAVSPEDHLAAGPISSKWCCLRFIFVCVHVFACMCDAGALV